jgi:hypothetical protein
MTLNVAIIGDSAMWGQGIARDRTFAALAAAGIARIRGESLGTVSVTARSGAKINAFVGDATYTATLPSGATMEVSDGDRVSFWITYPALFRPDDQTQLAFLTGREDSPAANLFGEIPATFPTVNGQIRDLFSDEDGRGIHLVLVNGSANDLNFEAILNPESNLDEDEIDAMIREFCYKPVRSMLRDARGKFPNALIIFTGYFSPFSARSDRARLKNLFYYMSQTPGWEVAVNEFVQSQNSGWKIALNEFLQTGQIPLIPAALNWLGITKDVDALVNAAIVRSEQASARGLYWLWSAVRDVQDNDPRVLFVHPAFAPENAVFADGPSFFWDRYKQPDDPDASRSEVVNDDMLEIRLEALRRQARLKLLNEFETLVTQFQPATDPTKGSALFDRATLDAIIEKADGPRGLVDFAKTIRGDVVGLVDALVMISILYPEIARIRSAETASLLHPNQAGAARYADRILAAYERYHRWSLRSHLQALAPPSEAGFFSVRAAMRRYTFPRPGGIRRMRDQLDIDSVAIEIEGLGPSAQINGVDYAAIRLALSGSHFFDFSLIGPQLSGTSRVILRTFDTFGRLQLGQIDRLSLGSMAGNSAPVLAGLTLTLNGRQAYSAIRESAIIDGRTLRFPFPIPPA